VTSLHVKNGLVLISYPGTDGDYTTEIDVNV